MGLAPAGMVDRLFLPGSAKYLVLFGYLVSAVGLEPTTY